MLKTFVSGLVLGSLLTILGALAIGPTVIIGDMQSQHGGNHGRYDLRVDEKDGATRYSILDTQTGAATIVSNDGKPVVIKAEAGAEGQ